MSLAVYGSSSSAGAWAPASRAATSATAPPATGAFPEAAQPSADELEAQGYRLLTDTDRALIESTTGLKIGPDYDSTRDGGNIFASQIATDRRLGRLSPNQEVSAVYLKDTARRFEADGSGRSNPFSGTVMSKALSYLAKHGSGRIDIWA